MGDPAAQHVTIRDARLLAERHVLAGGVLRPTSAERFFPMWERFERFAERLSGVTLAAEVTAATVVPFLDARTTSGAIPSSATKRVRCAALRVLFRAWRQLGFADHEPTLDLVLPARVAAEFRPLTDCEVEACRWSSLATTIATRQPAIWALAEAGVWVSEIPGVDVADLDLSSSRVTTSGSEKTRARCLRMTPWGVTQMRRHLARVPGRRVAVGEDTGSASARSSVAATLRRILRRAGVNDPAVSLASITGWAAARVLADTGSVEAAALAIGQTSLDRTAKLAGHDWEKGERLGPGAVEDS